MRELGYNYRLTDFQCALGMSQLKKLDIFVKIRRKIADKYNKAFSNIKEIGTPVEKGYARSSYHLYPIRLGKKLISRKRQIFDDLKNLGIGINVHYIPVPLQPFYRKTFGYKKGDFPNAESFYESELSLPIHPKLAKSEQNYIIKTVKNLIGGQFGYQR
jgi:dTDP-4-amino-4,6-dideoxygalactose transaminase